MLETPVHIEPPKPERIVRESLLDLGKLDHEDHQIGAGRIVVDHAYVPATDQPPQHISIYLGGLPHGPEQNTAGDPQEIGNIPTLLTTQSDAVVILKPEGLNNEAYMEGGQAFGQQRVAEASLLTLQRILSEKLTDRQRAALHFTLVGYSEGASQGASLAKQMLELGMNVDGLVGLEPPGVAGYSSQRDARIAPAHLGIDFVKKYIRRLREGDDGYIPKKTDYGYHIPRRLIDSYNKILDGEKPQTRDQLRNISNYGRRILGGVGRLDVPRRLVSERMKALWTKNHDYDALVSAGVPVSLFCGTLSDVIDYDGVQKQVSDWKRTIPNRRTQLISSRSTHALVNLKSLGVGFANALKPA